MISLNFGPKWWNWRLNWKFLGLKYFDLKLDRATQLSNGVCGSKLSLHFSWLSDFSSFDSYVMPTVYTRWSVNDVAVRDPPCLVSSKINLFNDISSHTMIVNFGEEILLIGSFFPRNPQQQVFRRFPQNQIKRYSCNNITTTFLIQISSLFYFGFFSKTNHGF